MPRGGCKSFENEDIIVRWYSTSNSLIIKGQDGELLRNELKLIANSMDESGGDSQDNELISGEGDGDSIASLRSFGKADEAAQSEEGPHIYDELQKKYQAEHMYGEMITEAVNEIKEQIKQLKLGIEENKASISNIKALPPNIKSTSDNESLEMYNLRRENEKLQRQNENLLKENAENTECMNNLANVLSDFNTKIKILKDEKASLITAISLIHDDYCQTSSKSKIAGNDQPSNVIKQNGWIKVKDRSAIHARVAESNDRGCFVVEDSNGYFTLND